MLFTHPSVDTRDDDANKASDGTNDESPTPAGA
jgi:hypothetical protein